MWRSIHILWMVVGFAATRWGFTATFFPMFMRLAFGCWDQLLYSLKGAF